MPLRQLPRTNDQRESAMRFIKERLDSPLFSDHPFRETTVEWLNAFFPTYATLLRDQRLAAHGQAAATKEVRNLKRTARIWVSHGYASVVNATVRGTFTRSVLSYYRLPLSAQGAPKLRSESDIVMAAESLESGETARVAAGGEPIAFPSVAEIMVHANAFGAANGQQANRKIAFADAQKAVANANAEADRLILRLWNEIETAFDVGDHPSMRRKAREWGVVYVPGRKEAPTAETNSAMGIITDKDTGKPLRKVRVQVEGMTARIRTNANGRYALPLLEPGRHVVRFRLKGYADEEQTMEVVEGEMIQVDVRMSPRTPNEQRTAEK